MLAQPGRHVVVDAVQQLVRAIRSVAIEDQPVDVALLGGRRVGLGLDDRRRAAARGADLERDDQDERDDHEDRRDAVERGVDGGEPAGAEADRRHDADDHERRPAGLLDDARHVDLAEQRRGVAVHQQAEQQGSDDQRRAPAVAEHEAEQEGRDGRDPDQHDQRQEHVRGVGLTQVLRPQEEDRVGREQQGMDGGESARFRGGLDRRFGRQENLRGGRRLG